MDKSVYQARWILIPMVGCFVAVVSLGAIAAG
jgi:hypothetical protein